MPFETHKADYSFHIIWSYNSSKMKLLVELVCHWADDVSTSIIIYFFFNSTIFSVMFFRLLNCLFPTKKNPKWIQELFFSVRVHVSWIMLSSAQSWENVIQYYFIFFSGSCVWRRKVIQGWNLSIFKSSRKTKNFQQVTLFMWFYFLSQSIVNCVVLLQLTWTSLLNRFPVSNWVHTEND